MIPRRPPGRQCVLLRAIFDRFWQTFLRRAHDTNESTVSTHTNVSNESNEITVSTSPTVATKCAQDDFVQTVA